MPQAFDILPFRIELAWSARLTEPEVLRMLCLPVEGVTLRQLWRRIGEENRRGHDEQVRRLGSGATRLALLLRITGSDGAVRDVLVRAKAERDGGKRYLEGVVADLSIEMRQRHEAIAAIEERADTAVRELNHRVRNIMSVVTALITLSARFAEDVDEFSAATLARIQALNIAYSNTGIDPSRPHLIRSIVDMHELANGVLATFRNEMSEIALCRNTLKLSPGQASAMGLILHELASNAREHGVLETEGGRVNVLWYQRGSQFEVRWEETTAEAIDDGFVDGFGMTIVKLFARNYLNGDAHWIITEGQLTVQITGLES